MWPDPTRVSWSRDDSWSRELVRLRAAEPLRSQLRPCSKRRPVKDFPPVPGNGYRVHAVAEHGGQIRLILKSFDNQTKPATWQVTVTTPRFAGQPFWFK
jgi:hypothetical protein